MKLISTESVTKVALFHGVEFEVPGGTQYMTASSHGRVVAWGGGQKPYLGSTVFHKNCYWDIDPYEDGWQVEVGKVDLEGMPWKDTLIELDDWQ